MADQDGVRARAFGEAAAAVDRFLEKFGGPGPKPAEVGEGAVNRLRAELGRVVDLNLDLVRNAFAFYGTMGGDQAGGQDALKLAPSPAGAVASSVVWLHNFDETDRAAVRLVGGNLAGEHLDVIEASAWSFRPEVVDVPARTGTPIVVQLSIPVATGPGTYRGQLTAVGLDGPPIEVSLEVVSLDPVPHESW